MDEFVDVQREVVMLFEEIAELGVSVEAQMVHEQVSANHVHRRYVLYATCEGQDLLEVIRVVTPHRRCSIEGMDHGLKVRVSPELD
jgi:hypothetical protein